ncbi:ead/Ea22-like family protein [Yersinia enterocolitica]
MNNLEELKKVAMKATQGEWVAFSNIKTGTFAVHTPHDKRCNDIVDWMGFDGAAGSKPQRSHNAKFIAAANPSVVLALIAQLEAAQKERDGLREKVNQADTEWQKMADRILAVGKRAEKAEAELSAANEPWRSFVTNDDISALNRFAECCDDPESGGHDLDKDQVERLVSIGALRKTKRNYHETTDFGDFVISAGFTVDGGE